MKTAVINIATGRHQRGQARLVESLGKVGYTGDILAFNNEAEVGAPKHKDCNYGFKPFAFDYCRKLGYDLVIWVDAAVWAIKPIDHLFEQIEKEEYLLFRNGWTSGDWSSDACLDVMAIDREESFKYPHLMACVMGFNLKNERCNQFLDEWLRLAKERTAFNGAWSNENKQVSQDDRVLGHRHDQTVASYLTWNMGMTNWLIPHETHLLYYQNGIEVPEHLTLLTQGM